MKTKLGDQEMACTVRRHFAPGSVPPGINEVGGGGVWDAQSVNWDMCNVCSLVPRLSASSALLTFELACDEKSSG